MSDAPAAPTADEIAGAAAPQPAAEPEVARGELITDGESAVEPVAVEEERREAVEEPAKVMRIGSMVKQLLEEVRQAPLDEASRERLAEIYERSIVELSEALSPDLQDELRNLALPFKDGEIPSDSELRIAKAQLVGWLEGLFHGIQAMMVAQQMAARQELEGARSELPERSSAQPPGPGYI